jgi:hypothetical protein
MKLVGKPNRRGQLGNIDIDVRVKVKGKIVPVLFFLKEHHAMKAYWGSGGIAPLIL